MHIDQKIFESHCPAFSNATDEVFEMVQPFFFRLFMELDGLLDGFAIDPTSGMQQLAEKYVCTGAAYDAVPHLDLVLTPTGFGVVRNDNVTPASQERVSSLREQLRQLKSYSRDMLVANLLSTSWHDTNSCAAEIDSICYSPLLCRRIGILHEGRQCYHEEYLALKPQITSIEQWMQQIISPELHQALINVLRHRTPDNGAYGAVIHELRKTIAQILCGTDIAQYNESYIPDRNKTMTVIAKGTTHETNIRTHLIRILNTYKAQLPEWTASSTYRALQQEKYENRKTDTTFFFG